MKTFSIKTSHHLQCTSLRLICIEIRMDELHFRLQDDIKLEYVRRINGLCQKRLERIPVQYIIGEWDFRNVLLKMKEPVFIPRPETETIVDIVKTNEDKINSFLEVGCGSGAISISLLSEMPKVKCVAIDQNISAVQLTETNAALNNLSDRLIVQHCKLLENGTLDTPLTTNIFDVIVSNPPYLQVKDVEDLQPELRYEDIRALDGGEEGMSIIKALLIYSGKHLVTGGRLVIELDPHQPKLIQQFLSKNNHLGLRLENIYNDFMDVNRFISVLKNAS